MKHIIFSVLLLITSTFAFAEELVIVYSDPVAPFLFVEKDQLQGIDVDIMNAVLNEMEMQPHYIYMPWARALENLQQGKVDGVLSVYCDQPTDNLLISSEQTYKTNISVFALSANGYTQQDLRSSNNGKIISVVRGNYYVSMLSKYPRLTKVELTDIFSQGYQLLKGHVDFSVSEELWFKMQMTSRKAGNKVEVIEVLDSTSVCLGFSASSFEAQPTFLTRLNETLRHLKQSRAIKGIFARYGLDLP